MKNAIILHGQPSKAEYYDAAMPSMSNAHWLPWLQAQLLKHDIDATTPEVPKSYAPDWNLWVREIERYELSPDSILVGHSRGGDFWLKYLSEKSDLRVGRVVLVAPSLGYLTEDDNHFGRFTIDPNLQSRTKGVTLIHSDNDSQDIRDSVSEIRSILKEVDYKEFHLGHFTASSMKTTEFPELLKVCLS